MLNSIQNIPTFAENSLDSTVLEYQLQKIRHFDRFAYFCIPGA